jgi:UDP-N-acetylmuramate--alanine ligase
VAVFQPHRYSRTAQFLDGFAEALTGADVVLVAPLYAAGEAPLPGVSSDRLAQAVRLLAPHLPVEVAGSLDELAARVAAVSRPGDLVMAMGAGDVNGLWERLGALDERGRPTALAA